MSAVASLVARYLLILGIGLLPSLAQASKPMPTASLPIEPASPDLEFREEPQDKAVEPEPSSPASAPAAAGTRSVRQADGHEAAVQAGLRMSRDNFGAELRFLEYSKPWLAIRQSLRYQAEDRQDAFFVKQYGLMLGLEAHPWRSARLSPLLVLEAGGDRYFRRDGEELDLFGFTAALAAQLKLARAASFLFQWIEVYYPGLDQPLFFDGKAGRPYAGSFQVSFNLQWEGFL